MNSWILNAQGDLLTHISCSSDIFQMNWVRDHEHWGKTRVPNGMSCCVSRCVFSDETLEETYTFTNDTDFDLYCPEGSIDIAVPLNDSYAAADICLSSRCHAHIFCGGEISWILALRMGGTAPHLGLVVTKGALESYSIRRSPVEGDGVSNVRGVFLLHPASITLLPHTSFSIVWKMFWHKGKEDFIHILQDHFHVPFIKSQQWVAFQGEEIGWTGGRLDTSETGMQTIPLILNGLRTHAHFLVIPDAEFLLKQRAMFIVKNQQCLQKESHLYGAYLIYDNETGKQYYNHEVHDHNSCRERVGMGALIALALQRHFSPEAEKSLQLYSDFLLREIYDEDNKKVCNDIQYSLDWHRLYNYPWVAVFFMELFRLYKDPVWILRSADVMEGYYRAKGEKFYAIGIPMLDMIQLLNESGNGMRAEEMRNLFLKHAQQICSNGLHFPTSEVDYEQSIVAPSVTILLMGYILSANQDLLEAAHEQMKLLSLFHGIQPDYHLHEVAIRHWDGYWFGKRKMLGDTFPHYWNSLSGIAFSLYGQITGNSLWIEKAERCLRGSLSLFRPDGSASCAMIYPRTVNDKPGHFYDPWANDQDWGLYYYLRRPVFPL